MSRTFQRIVARTKGEVLGSTHRLRRGSEGLLYSCIPSGFVLPRVRVLAGLPVPYTATGFAAALAFQAVSIAEALPHVRMLQSASSSICSKV